VSKRNDSGKTSYLWNVLSQAGLIEIDPEDLASRIKTTRHLVVRRMQELLAERNERVERESAASALGILAELERRVRVKGKAPEQ
jgi:hypothetical protein